MDSRRYAPSPSGESEDPEKYRVGGLHPVIIGDVLKNGQYKIIHKLGFGSFSTTWLARDSRHGRYVSIKIERADELPESNELRILRHIASLHTDHAGYQYVMTLLDDFKIEGPNGLHRAYVSEVAGRRLTREGCRNAKELASALAIAKQVGMGLSYLRACNVAHGDLYSSNILMGLRNFDDWSEEDIYACMGQPQTEKVVKLDDQAPDSTAPVYTVRRPDLSTLESELLDERVLIIDFGQAFYLDARPAYIITPAPFSAPEILFRSVITPAIDIWAFGCVTYELCSGFSLFKMLFVPRLDVLKDYVSALGRPPDELWSRWSERDVYFNEDGSPKSSDGRRIAVKMESLTQRVHCISKIQEPSQDARHAYTGEEGAARALSDQTPAKDFLAELDELESFLRSVIVYRASDRPSIDEALQHPLFGSIGY